MLGPLRQLRINTQNEKARKWCFLPTSIFSVYGTFHPLGSVLVICDAGNYFQLLQDCGILCSQLNAYNNKFLTVELFGVDEALKVMDNIHSSGYYPVMYLYDNGKQILDNIEP